MDKKEAIDKIRKCLALANSGEPHEAAAAMRQAQKLMQKFGIDHPELITAGVSEEWAKSNATTRPTRYEVVLASAIACAFSCEIVFTRQLSKSQQRIDGGYSFVGVAPSPEVASYTFVVLRRQLQRARATYIKAALKRHRKNKTVAADLFCEGWVIAVRRLIATVAPTPEQKRAIDTYMRVNYAQTTTCDPRQPANLGNGDDHRSNGYDQGTTATLHQAVGGRATAELLEYGA